MLLKEVRLRALRDAPYAFGGIRSFKEESVLPDSYWHQLAAEAGGEVSAWRDRCVSYVVFHEDDAVGTGSCYLCPRVAGRAYFSAAWVDPRFRLRGIGGELVRKAIGWAEAHGANHLRLWVDNTNPGAARFYEAIGFAPTGDSRAVWQGGSELERSYELRLDRT